MPIFVGSKNNSSSKLFPAIQSKKKIMNKFRFCIKITNERIKTNKALPI